MPATPTDNCSPPTASSRACAAQGTAIDNAHLESFRATLKTELLQERLFATHAEARNAIFLSIETFSNRARLHGALGFTSPVEYESNPG